MYTTHLVFAVQNGNRLFYRIPSYARASRNKSNLHVDRGPYNFREYA